MFRTVFPSIIRSARLYIQRQVYEYVIKVRWLHASLQSTNLCDIYLMLYVQSITSDDGRKDRPKHVEWCSINSKNCAPSWFWHRNISRCTVPWTSNKFQINHQPDATIFHFIILTFIYSSTCFGRSPAHYQELNDCSSILWFYLLMVVIAVLCSWSNRLFELYDDARTCKF